MHGLPVRATQLFLFLYLCIGFTSAAVGDELDEHSEPDFYGYYYLDSQEDDGPVYSWVDISETGDQIPVDIWENDAIVGPVQLDFQFELYGTSTWNIYLSSEGYILLEATDEVYPTNSAIPDTNAPNGLIAWFWDALDPTFEGLEPEIYTGSSGDSAFVIQFEDFCAGEDTTYRLRAEVLLFADGDILLQYDSLPEGLPVNSETIGIEGEEGFDGQMVSFNDSPAEYPYEELAIRFYHLEEDALLMGTVTDSANQQPVEFAEVRWRYRQDVTDNIGEYEVGPLWSGWPLVFVTSAYGYFTRLDTVELAAGANDLDVGLRPWPQPYVSWTTNFETGPDLFYAIGQENAWAWGVTHDDNAHSGELGWGYVSASGYEPDQRDTLAVVLAWEVGGENASASYWHRYETTVAEDGYHVMLSLDSMETWEIIVPESGYDENSVEGLGFEPGFSGQQGEWEEVAVDLGEWAGQSIHLAFVFGSDAAPEDSGYVYIDDFAIQLPDGAIEGEVLSAGTEEPIQDAEVALYELNNTEPVLLDSTDAEGRFAFNHLRAMDYVIEVGRIHFFNSWRDTVAVEIEDTLQVTVELDSIPLYTCEEIQQYGAPGDLVRLQGVVTLGDNIISRNETRFFVQDTTGYGLQVYSPTPPDTAAPARRGDRIHLWGEITEADSNTVLVDYEFEILAEDQPLPEPVELTTGEAAAADSLEGSRIMVSGRLLDAPQPYGIYTVDLDDNTGSVEVHLYPSAQIVMMDYRRFDWITVRGVLTHNVLEDLWIIPGANEDVTVYLYPPRNAAAELVDSTDGVVELAWERTPQPGQVYELAYERGVHTGSYQAYGYTLCTRFSPELPGRLLSLKYYTITTSDDDPVFSAWIYPWEQGQPAMEPAWTDTVIADSAAWIEVDVSGEELEFDRDFAVGFNAEDGTAQLGFDATHNNGRSIDFNGTNWNDWHQAYLIRAIVEYQDGEVAVLGPEPFVGAPAAEKPEPRVFLSREGEWRTSTCMDEGPLRPGRGHHRLLDNGELDDFSHFEVQRDMNELGITTEMSWVDTLPDFGDYVYSIVAVYDEATSQAAGPLEVHWIDTSSPEDPSPSLPAAYAVRGVYPNPFNARLSVEMALPEEASVTLSLFDVLGRERIGTTIGRLEAGISRVTLSGESLPSGVYFIRIKLGQHAESVHKVILLR